MGHIGGVSRVVVPIVGGAVAQLVDDDRRPPLDQGQQPKAGLVDVAPTAVGLLRAYELLGQIPVPVVHPEGLESRSRSGVVFVGVVVSRGPGVPLTLTLSKAGPPSHMNRK